MNKIYNPSMQEEPFNHPTRIIPLRQEETILSWLENSGRFRSRDLDEDYANVPTDLVDEIIEVEPYSINDDEYDNDDDDL